MISINRISTSYGAMPVLHEVSLDVKEGEVVALIGANNAGKSTLLKVIAGLHKPTSGEITFKGEDLSALPPHEIVNKGIVLIPQGGKPFSEMSVVENLLIGSYSARAKAERDASFEKVYQLFPVLKQRRKQLASTLSGGERQMLALGRGLMVKPEVLLLDEPSIGLGPILIKEIYSVLQELNRQGLTILLVEQNAKYSLSLSSRAFVLVHGRVAISGRSEDLAQDEAVRKAYLGIVE